jgi:cobalt-zinc-cadmium resistance protein CzcA
MIDYIIKFSVRNKLIVFLFVLSLIVVGLYSITQIPIGAVPDVTNNQVQVITTSRNLSTQDVEQFITYPIELAMANLPGVMEIRSVSKFGLSVVTVVFEDRLGTYLPRQLIAEKLVKASELIPAGMGTPELGPITTGLGEIYQYTLETRPGYDTIYSTMQLRTIQDWIVKRQLSGIPGVVEVNTWGGFLKQYEVSVDPARLKAMNVTITEVYDALSNNNENAGGGYIEKGMQSYFVRGEGKVKNFGDIQNIVVKNVEGVPIKVRDIGEVHFGFATRFGAITGNGEGEKVLGQVMMLKKANSNKVINAVKDRVAQIQPTLPEGVYINPFLDRSELIGRTTTTVVENLMLGAIIVIFVVVLLMGNLRSGLIVASVIPIALLFSITMMNIFGISANLMSLGAIDFGIIIDGAVIIVEYTLHQFTIQKKELLGLKDQMLELKKDELAIDSSKRMMNSAFFGQAIILMVFIPILSLQGVEGKMFKPMALAFGFALIGSIFLCLTFVPAVSALFLKPERENFIKKTSDKFLEMLQRSYSPVIRYALKNRIQVLIIAVLFFALGLFLFSRMGGEFIPTLDEGDYVVQPVLKPGTSLTETIDFNTRIENILMENFPEVEQVVTRIGAAEVPTDPMSMEMSDIIIRLKSPDQWVSARSKEELANLMKEKMSVFPGVSFEFTQPIEMRFNELITGVRADLAIKIFGEDLNLLFNYGQRIKSLIEDVKGAADVTVEQIVGLPQMTVQYDRERLAQYGLNVSELNKMIQIAFGGLEAGNVFEGERRFDLVVRFNKENRKSINNLENLFVRIPNGESVPMKELADIDYNFGPAQISRDGTRRRIVIGINVRNRDVESLVHEISGIINQHINLPAGYYITYGGQFENLQNAKKRLSIAIPVALVIILILLHFTFYSFKQALLIFSAIPMAAIGGVLALWIRGMPFSISAGVGFIALFGIATLNGVVLISFLNELRDMGVKDLKDRVLQGTSQRLRPVLITASAAAFGFFPMAFSTSAGAEVQRPLATVVIGGLITATLLTMVVLPVLYCMYTKKQEDVVC